MPSMEVVSFDQLKSIYSLINRRLHQIFYKRTDDKKDTASKNMNLSALLTKADLGSLPA